LQKAFAMPPWKLILGFIALAFVGCSAETTDERMGTLGLPLAATQGDVTYRVVGTIRIYRNRDDSLVATIDADAGSPDIETVELLPGTYTVEVVDGYSCSVTPAVANFSGCTYAGAEPERFVVTAGRTSTVVLNFTFSFEEDVAVVLRSGGAEFVLSPVENSPCGAESCTGEERCTSVDGASPVCTLPCETNDDCPVGERCFLLEDESASVCASVVTEVWTHQFGSSSYDYAMAVSTDRDGNVFVAGYTFDALPGATNQGSLDAFVRKLDANGNVLWTHQFGSDEDDFGTSVHADGDGGVLVGGETFGTLPDQNNAGPRGTTDAFVQKLDANGDVLWTHQFGSDTYETTKSLSTDANGNAFVAGYTSGTLPDAEGLGFDDAFVRKLDPNGNVLWTRQLGSDNNDYAFSVATDGDGSVFVAGITAGSLPGQVALGQSDATLQKLDADGELVWSRQFGTSAEDYAYSVATDGAGRAFTSGITYGALPGQSQFGEADAFVRGFDGDGNATWTRQFGTALNDSPSQIAADRAGNLIVGGFTDALFPTATGEGRALARKLDPDGEEVWTIQFGSWEDEVAAACFDDDGNVLLAGWTVGLEGQPSSGPQDAFVKKLGP
jgi:hypothetical protein